MVALRCVADDGWSCSLHLLLVQTKVSRSTTLYSTAFMRTVWHVVEAESSDVLKVVLVRIDRPSLHVPRTPSTSSITDRLRCNGLPGDGIIDGHPRTREQIGPNPSARETDTFAVQ